MGEPVEHGQNFGLDSLCATGHSLSGHRRFSVRQLVSQGGFEWRPDSGTLAAASAVVQTVSIE